MKKSNHKSKLKSQNWGSAFIRTKESREQYLLQQRTLRDLAYWEWIFIIVSTIGTLINLGFNIYDLVISISNGEKYVFPILAIINNVTAVGFLFYGVIKELPFQILMQLLTKATVWVFNMIFFLSPKDFTKDNEYENEKTTEDEVKAIRFYVSSSLLFLTIPVGGYVLYRYWTSNIAIFKTVGTEPKYVKMSRWVFLSHGLLAFDNQVFLLSLILVASAGLSTQDLLPIIFLPVGILFIVLWTLVGYHGIKKENRIILFTFYVLSHVQPLYIIYLIIRSPKNTVGPLLFHSIITIAGIFFVMHILLMGVVVRIHFNFDKGLKQAADREFKRSQSMAQSLNQSREYLETGRPRFETDI